jgi:hypothetical protein
VCCRNPALAESRRLKREALLAATEADLEKIRKPAEAGRLKDKDKIGVRAGKVIGKHKVGKHFTWDITGDGFTFRRDEEKIAAEARLDGIYVIRTTMTADTADATGVVRTCKNLKYVERDFKTIKIDDLDIRPIRHYLAGRVEAHLLICILAAYLTWHLREAFAPLTFTDEDIPEPADPVIPARRSPRAATQDAIKETPRRPAALPLSRPAGAPGDPGPASYQFRRPANREDHHPDPGPGPRVRAARLTGPGQAHVARSHTLELARSRRSAPG